MSETSKTLKFLKKFSMNLTNNNDPQFKILKILKLEDKFFIDIRQTSKGTPTTEGVCLLIPEFRWIVKKFVDSINMNKKIDKFLEYGNRTVHIFENDNICIELTKFNGDKNKVMLTNGEKDKLVQNFKEIDENITKLAKEYKIDIEIDNEIYFNEI